MSKETARFKLYSNAGRKPPLPRLPCAAFYFRRHPSSAERFSILAQKTDIRGIGRLLHDAIRRDRLLLQCLIRRQTALTAAGVFDSRPRGRGSRRPARGLSPRASGPRPAPHKPRRPAGAQQGHHPPAARAAGPPVDPRALRRRCPATVLRCLRPPRWSPSRLAPRRLAGRLGQERAGLGRG